MIDGAREVSFAPQRADEPPEAARLTPGTSGCESTAQFCELSQRASVPIPIWTVKDVNQRETALLSGSAASVVFIGDNGAVPFDDVALLSRTLVEGRACPVRPFSTSRRCRASSVRNWPGTTEEA